MSNDITTQPVKIDKLIRIAVILVMAGMLMVLLFLITGFQAWSVGIGVFLGMPVMLAGVVLYVYAVLRDLRQRKVLDEEES
jgi:membrane protein YdbS with pleckstrin-like domain